LIIDANAIIDIFTNQQTKQNFLNYFSGDKSQLVICSEIFEELNKPRPQAKWPGYYKEKIKEKIEKDLSRKVFNYETSNEIEESAKELVKKYPDYLHYPDSHLLAIAKLENWPQIISSDIGLETSCLCEAVLCFIPGEMGQLTIKTPKLSFDESLDEFFLMLKNKKVSNERIDKITIFLFRDLAYKWRELDLNNVGLNNTETKENFEKYFHKIITEMKTYDPVFDRLHGKKYDDAIVKKFFRNIRSGSISSYKKLTDLLRSKEEIKQIGIDSWKSDKR